MTTHSIAVCISALALMVAVGATTFGAALANDGATEQGAAFVVTGISVLIGVAAGLVAVFAAAHQQRRGRWRWSIANVVVGFGCAAIDLLVSIGNMNL